jgi:DMSO/TMAO reductase YedYZ molybdopterin-dependent catalytic subunit
MGIAAAAMASGPTALAGAADAALGSPPKPMADFGPAKIVGSYLTAADDFGDDPRVRSLLEALPAAKLSEAGLDRQSWRLEIVPEEKARNVKLERAMTMADGSALSFAGLMKLAETRAVRVLKVMSAIESPRPLGMGLWEGVPLREVIWATKPSGNIRRICYSGYRGFQSDPSKPYQASLTTSRVMIDEPWGLPVLLCYKLNGQWLEPRLGGPVRVIVPEEYENRCLSWVNRIELSPNFQETDSYGETGNDVESPLKTCAYFSSPAGGRSGLAGQPITLTGFAQVGAAGLARVQYAIAAEGRPVASDADLAQLVWRDARLMGPPTDWGGGLPGGKLPLTQLQCGVDGVPREWPLRYTICHWTAQVTKLGAGKYTVLCRTIDLAGNAQPLPRRSPTSGINRIEKVELLVRA